MSELTTHELARQLLELNDVELTISLDLSTCDQDATLRAFSGDFFGPESTDTETVLMFSGSLNEKRKMPSVDALYEWVNVNPEIEQLGRVNLAKAALKQFGDFE